MGLETSSANARRLSGSGYSTLMLPLSPSPYILNVMTDSCAEAAEWETALELLAQLRAGQAEEGGEPLDADTVSFNATINALGRGGEWKKAVALLREMTKAGLGVKVT